MSHPSPHDNDDSSDEEEIPKFFIFQVVVHFTLVCVLFIALAIYLHVRYDDFLDAVVRFQRDGWRKLGYVDTP